MVASGTTQINLSGELRVRGWYGSNIDSTGFALAPRLVLERSVAEPLAEPTEEV